MSDEPQKSEVAEREERILDFWNERDIFKKSLEKGAPRGEFIFYEGPPTANGHPGIHHLESRAFKDAVLRYRTMRGYHVRRKAGWDTHGLPVELEVEKEIGSKSKQDIEAYGVAKFNAKCKESVLRYIDEWKAFTERIAFWVDHDDTYFTFDNAYIESVWNILKTAYGRKLLYKDYKVVPWCPRCGTALSSHEVAQGYQEDTPDPSVYVKFKLIGAEEYLMAWTTTPWTLPGNVALAVGEDVVYAKVQTDSGIVWLAKDRLEAVLPDAQLLAEVKGGELVGREYEPLFPYLNNTVPEKEKGKLVNAYKVYAADFVSTTDGTGIVHTAVMYGADDFELGTKVGLPKHHLVGEDGKFTTDAGPLQGMFFKKADEWVMQDLADRALLFRKETITHTYPFCWRCTTPLIYYADDSWYIKMSEIKDDLIRENKTIHWEPGHIQDGRFGEWLRELKDWAISRSRFWGTPLPIWECDTCKHFDVIGSVAELKEKAGSAPNDLHRPHLDGLIFQCEKCDGVMRRVPEVLDVWFDSGAMPFAQDHYPFDFAAGGLFEGKELPYPADYICEAIDQTRGWFYTLHAVGGIMGKGKAYKNVICLGHVLDAKGKKMSKSVGNVVNPNAMISKYGVDALRYFMFTVNAPGDSKNFDERMVDEIVKKNLGRLNNVLAFWKLYDDPSTTLGAGGTVRDWKSTNVLDRWIIARLDELILEATEGFEEYTLDTAMRPIADFIDDLSVWYLRRSRDRFKTDADPSTELGASKQAALATLRFVLHRLSLVIAPSMPFFAEYLFQAVREEEDEESAHLASWPDVSTPTGFLARLFGGNKNKALLDMMRAARGIVSQALEAREKAGIKVRQPLQILEIPVHLPVEFANLIADEVNVKFVAKADKLSLDTTLTDELREEGIVRDAIREIQAFRKESNLRPGQHVTHRMRTQNRAVIEKNIDQVQKATNTTIEFE
ncbi:MAG: Isoleucine-tRNA ligase [Candidatus Kaiserbacteria bacterium GW2011_GWB1_52_6]|nr:MAG: Isoleucine-tRNA ligase [Candidatus Kaiserbacteria bacterium GW2011_GWA2_52_12]KKW27945.1 MAG: Isoleucine-tRNA ligase [Candidatus Kaiserbacteria bacterium GW2011_GWB1_52_6]